MTFEFEEEVFTFSNKNSEKGSIKNNTNTHNINNNQIIKDFKCNDDSGNYNIFEYDLIREKNNNLYNTSSKATSDNNLVINKFNEKQRQNILKKANFQTLLETEENESLLFNNDQIKKFNSWDNTSNVNANKLISSTDNNNHHLSIFNVKDLSDQKQLAFFYSTNPNVFNKRSSDINLIQNQQGSNIKSSLDYKAQPQLNNTNIAIKNVNISPYSIQENDSTPSNSKIISESCSYNNSNKNHNFISKDPLFNFEDKASSKLQKEEEYTDYEANFAFEARFITNNKKIPIMPSMINQTEKQDCINKTTDFIFPAFKDTKEEETKPSYSKESQKLYSKEMFVTALKSEKYIASKNNSELNINQNDFLKKFKTSDTIRPARIYLEINDFAAASSSDHNLLVTAEMDKTNNNNFNNKKSLSGGPNYFMSNYKSNKSTSNDDSKQFGSNVNLLNFNSKESNNFNSNSLNYFNSGNSNNNISKNSNSNKKNNNTNKNKDTNSNSNNKNSISNDNPNSNFNFYDNLNDLNSKRNVNNKVESNKANKNLAEEKEYNFNLDSQLRKFNSQDNSNNKSSNSNFSFKTKQSQKKQIFFPVEVSIKSFNSANSVYNNSNKTISDFPCSEKTINWNTLNYIDNLGNSNIPQMKCDKNSNSEKSFES